ncbi:MAG: ABC transporter ATP-binding protein [Candidatus Saccharibacteria bacterium]|nr:ABC transporter ATP-binding protein [Candidatus Saccharibacteria bacterium]
MKQSTNVKQTLGLFWRFTKPHKKSFWIGTGGAGLAVIAQEIIPPLIISRAFDVIQRAAQGGEALQFTTFVPYLLAYFISITLGLLLWRTQVWHVWRYEIAALQHIAIYIFDHLQHLEDRFHASNFGGSLVSQTTKFLRAYERTMDELTWSITTGIVAYVSSFGVLLFTAPLYAAAFFVLSIIYFVVMYRRTKATLPYDRALASSESERTGKLADMVTNVSAVRSFANEEYELGLFTAQAKDTSSRYWNLLSKAWVNDLISHSMNNTIAFVAFLSGIIAITDFGADAGVLFLAVSYTMSLTRRLRESNRVFRNLNRALGDANDMTYILRREPDVKDAEHAKDLRVPRGSIELKGVNFAYPDVVDGSLLFENLDLRIKPGEKIGLVGHSGSGKTTITKLLQRTMDVSDGSIDIDGQNIAEVTQRSLRKVIATVPQEPLLFHRSITENIAYARPDATDEEISAAAKLANADSFIADMPHGYDTLVGERGVKLSGGQRQRIAIARAILKNAPILVLDEATSALDSESETLIQDALWKLMQNRTALVVAHRLSTIQKMDRILVMENGEIVEEGTHKELMYKAGIYAELWSHQSGGFLEE